MNRILSRDVTRVLLCAVVLVSGCAPGRSIVRGNWPDGRIHSPTRYAPIGAPVVRVAPGDAMIEEWLPAEPAAAPLTPADLNRMRVLETIHFAFDRAEIRRSDVPIMEANARWLAETPTARIIIEGHCDERGTRVYNQALGQRRAEAARDFLVSLGVDPSRIEVVSYGEELPLDPGHNERAWSQNRRADFVIAATRP